MMMIFGLQKTCAEVLPTIFIDVHVSLKQRGTACGMGIHRGAESSGSSEFPGNWDSNTFRGQLTY